MHEDYRNAILVELGKIVTDQEMLLKVIGAVDYVSNKYDITPKDTGLVPEGAATAEIIKLYLATCKCGGMNGGQSKGTIKNKGYALNKFFSTVKMPFTKVTTNDIRAYLYVTADKVSDKAAEKARQYLSGFYKFCVMEKLVTTNPCENIGRIKTEKAEIKPLSTEEMYKLRMAAEAPIDKALIEFMYSTGARIAEVANMKIADVDFAKSEAYLFGKGQKHRTTFISIPCAYALKEYLESRSDDNPYLFVSERGHHGVTSDALRDRVHSISAKAGLHVNPHQIRHTTATNLQGAMPIQNISKYLGHENVGTTMIYAQVDRRAMRSEFERVMN